MEDSLPLTIAFQPLSLRAIIENSGFAVPKEYVVLVFVISSKLGGDPPSRSNRFSRELISFWIKELVPSKVAALAFPWFISPTNSYLKDITYNQAVLGLPDLQLRPHQSFEPC